MKPRRFTFWGTLLKSVVFVLGLAVSVLWLSALLGPLIASGWLRIATALLGALAVPLLAIRWVLSGVETGALRRGFTLAAMGYVLGAACLFWFLRDEAPSILLAESERLSEQGLSGAAHASHWLADFARDPATSLSPWRAPAESGPLAEPIETTASAAPHSAPQPSAPPASQDELSPPPSSPREVNEVNVEAAPVPLPVPPSVAVELSPAQIFARFADAVVTVNVSSAMGDGHGSGFVLDGSLLVATNHHVIEGARRISVKLHSGEQIDELAVVVDDAALDLALLRVREPLPPHSVILGDSDALVVGERVVALGNPFGLEHTLTDGLVSARRMLDGRKWVQISAPISRGNSGGPLFNARGEVVAVNTAAFNPMLGAQNLNLAVPINDLKPLVERANRTASGKRAASW